MINFIYGDANDLLRKREGKRVNRVIYGLSWKTMV